MLGITRAVLTGRIAMAEQRWGDAAIAFRDGGYGTPVLVDGATAGIVGRVSMDMITVDISHIPQAAIGTEVTLWGRGPHGSSLPIDEVAQHAGTIGYELMCAVAPRVGFAVG